MSINLRCFTARTQEELTQVYRLRYDTYRCYGWIPPNAELCFRDSFDGDLNHFSFLVSDDFQRAVATVRVSVVRPDLGWYDSPCRHLFGDQPASATTLHSSFVEVSHLCLASQHGSQAFVHLVANMRAMADFYQVEWVVACAHMEQAPVYREVFGFQTVGVNLHTELVAVRRADLQNHFNKKHAPVGVLQSYPNAQDSLLAWRIAC